MAQPAVTSISFDKSVYEPGDTITATVIYTSSDTHGGDGNVGYSLAVALTDEITAATNAGLSGQVAEFYVDSGPVLPNQVKAAVTAALAAPAAVEATSLATGLGLVGSAWETSSFDAPGGSVLFVFVYMNVTGISGLGLTWTYLADTGSQPGGQPLYSWYAEVPSGGASGAISFTGTNPGNSDVVGVTGLDLGEPFIPGNVQVAGGAAGSPASVTFSAASNAGNRFLFATGPLYPSTPAESPPWTELSNTVGSDNGVETQVSPGASSLVAAASTNAREYYSWGAIGVELNVFQSGTGLPPSDWTLIFNNLDADGTGTAVFQAVA